MIGSPLGNTFSKMEIDEPEKSMSLPTKTLHICWLIGMLGNHYPDIITQQVTNSLFDKSLSPNYIATFQMNFTQSFVSMGWCGLFHLPEKLANPQAFGVEMECNILEFMAFKHPKKVSPLLLQHFDRMIQCSELIKTGSYWTNFAIFIIVFCRWKHFFGR